MLSDALILASQVDKVLLVGAAGQVTRDAFDEMVRLLQHARGNILGAVLNKLRLTQGDYYYYYYYYYYDYAGPHSKANGKRDPKAGPSPKLPPRASATPPPPSDEDLPF
jgi:Mrp family chromosome partitioning ATPase